MGAQDLAAAALVKSHDAAKRDSMISERARVLVAAKVSAELSELTDEDKDAFLAGLIEHGNVHKACLSVGTSRMSMNAARKRDPLFAAAWAEVLENRVDDVEQVLYEQCMDPSSANTIARFFYLKAWRSRYREAVQSAERPSQTKVHVVVELNRKADTQLPPKDDIVDAEVVEPLGTS